MNFNGFTPLKKFFFLHFFYIFLIFLFFFLLLKQFMFDFCFFSINKTNKTNIPTTLNIFYYYIVVIAIGGGVACCGRSCYQPQKIKLKNKILFENEQKKKQTLNDFAVIAKGIAKYLQTKKKLKKKMGNKNKYSLCQRNKFMKSWEVTGNRI